MPVRVSSLAGRARSGRTPFLLLGVLVLLPAVLLVALGVRTLVQDTRLAEAQARERLDRAAALAAQDLERGLGQWDRALAEVGAEAEGVARLVPPLISETLDTNPDAVLVRIGSRQLDVLPAGRLLYTLEPESPVSFRPARLSAALQAGEILEIQKQDYARAAQAYRALLKSPDAAVRPLALLRLARTEAKAGRLQESLKFYEALERETGAMIGDLPADFVGTVQRCEVIAASGTPAELTLAASAFYRSLTSGRWLMEKPRYLHYSEQARQWLAGATGVDRLAMDGLEAAEQQKMVLSDAVGDIRGAIRAPGMPSAGHRLFTPVGRQYLAFWRQTPTKPQAVLLVLGAQSLRSRVWPAMFPADASDDVVASLIAPDGAVVFATANKAGGGLPGTAAPSGGSVSTFREQTLQDGDLLWRVRATAERPDSLYAEVARRRWLYVAMLAVMVGGLLVAGLIAGRTLRREVEVARLKSQFVSAVSHEFRSPLTGISQLSELLVGGKVADEARRQQYYNLIYSESRRLSRLVEQVLDFARMEDGRKEYRFERAETSGWLRRAADEFQQTPAAQGKKVEVSVPDGLPPLMMDGQAVTGAIHNLLDNAVKYSPGRDTVWLDAAATANGAGVTISVRDEGVGIPPDEQRHLFERFFRGHSLADSVAGTGLGLSLVRHVVAAHGGEISVESTPGKGTTFTVVLPQVRNQESGAGNQGAGASWHPGS
jgi:signal transduction histidine kinase